ncbi:MAG: RDD family protein [Pseudomonadota bacterium]
MTVAGPVARALAWSIDTLFRTAIYIVIGLLLSLFVAGDFMIGLYFIILFLMEWFYFVFYEVYREGQTPGKSTMGLRVLCDDGTSVDWSASMIRNLLRFVDFLPFIYGFGLISMLIGPDFKRLGDLVAGTIVVYSETQRLPSTLPEVQPLSPQYALTLEEQQALVSFAERSVSLTPQRNEELAQLTGPLTDRSKTDSKEMLEGVLATAAWIAGRR